MRAKKFRIPQIEYDATACAYPAGQSAKHIAICCCVEMAKALTHDNRGIECAGARPIVSNVCRHEIDSAMRFTSSRDYLRIPINSGHQVTKIRKRARMSPHAAADIQNVSKLRQRRTAADEFRLPNRPRLIDPDMKKLEPFR
jgi:hypothetical protein